MVVSTILHSSISLCIFFSVLFSGAYSWTICKLPSLAIPAQVPPAKESLYQEWRGGGCTSYENHWSAARRAELFQPRYRGGPALLPMRPIHRYPQTKKNRNTELLNTWQVWHGCRPCPSNHIIKRHEAHWLIQNTFKKLDFIYNQLVLFIFILNRLNNPNII